MLDVRLCIRRCASATIALACLFAGLLLPAPAGARDGGCEYRSRLPAKASAADLRQAVTCLINRRRAARGLGTLRVSPLLRRAATGHSRSMVRYDYFSHYGRSGSTFIERIRRTGYLASAAGWSVGEVIATGFGRRATARAVVRAWMHSPGHRAQILSGRYRELGVGVEHGMPGAGRRGATYTIDFGARS